MAMSYKVEIEREADKFMAKLSKSQPKIHAKIDIFINEVLPKEENPCELKNAKHLTAFKDNKWRWRLGNYRIIANVINGSLKIIKIIRVAKRDENTYKGL